MMMIVPEACRQAVRNAWMELGFSIPPSRLTSALLSLATPLQCWPAAMLEEGGLHQLVFEGDAFRLLHLLHVLPPCALHHLEQGQAQFQPQCWQITDGQPIASLVVGRTRPSWRRSGNYIMWWTCIDGLAVRIQLWTPECLPACLDNGLQEDNRDPFLADIGSPLYYWRAQHSVLELVSQFIGWAPIAYEGPIGGSDNEPGLVPAAP